MNNVFYLKLSDWVNKSSAAILQSKRYHYDGKRRLTTHHHWRLPLHASLPLIYLGGINELYRLAVVWGLHVLYLEEPLLVCVLYLTWQSYFYTSPWNIRISCRYSLLPISLIGAHRKAFSLTQMCRNLYTGRSSTTCFLPQAEAAWSPWQPHHSDDQCGVGVSGAAALGYRPSALISHRAGMTAITVPSFNCLSHSRLRLLVKWASVYFFVVVFQASCGSVCSTCLGDCQSQGTWRVWKPDTSERMSETSLTPPARSQC